jgi:hypothetical protein
MLWHFAQPRQRVSLPIQICLNTRAVPVLNAGVLFVLAILCANASCLMLGRLSGARVCHANGARRRPISAHSPDLLRVACRSDRNRVGAFLAWGTFLVRTLNPLSISVGPLLVTWSVGVAATLLTGMLPATLRLLTSAGRDQVSETVPSG